MSAPPKFPLLRLHHSAATTVRFAAAAAAAKSSASSPDPLPPELQLIADVRTPYNHIRVADVSAAAAGFAHPLAGARLLLLDSRGGGDPLTSTYLDVFATIPPLLPQSASSLAVLGFGAGSAARSILHFFPHLPSLHGWEIDPAVISVSRDFFDLAELEEQHADRLFVHVGDAFHAEGVFGGVLVDLFANGSVLPELQEASTWRRIGAMVAAGGRIMVNCGGPCVEAEEEERDGEAVKEATLGALMAAFGCEMVSVMEVDQSWVAMTGPAVSPVMAAAWKGKLPPELRRYVDMWRPCSP
uniref:PABS domain-containing protein n=1 Tax=Leersia perrieri TaxID=77586 RepID=A0A0D9WMK2_9ORYZ